MFLSEDSLAKVGFKSYGKNILISDKCSIYNPSNISIGDNTRIDDFCILSAGEKGIELGSYVHIACYCSLIGNEKIIMKDFSGLSSNVSIYSSTDDFSGEFMGNPCVPNEFKNILSKPVVLNKHVGIGAKSTVLPGVEIGENSKVYAHSLVTKSFAEDVVIFGVPARKIKNIKNNTKNLEKLFLNKINS
jgi:acetyltransferase-like isoleucine patch superfamily enzyme